MGVLTMKFVRNVWTVVLYFSWTASCILTVNFMVEVFNMSPVWIFVGMVIGVVCDLGKAGCIRWNIINPNQFAFYLGFALIVLSLAATVGALQSHLEKCAMTSPEYLEKRNTLSRLDNQIADLRATAAKQKEINYITRSKRTLSEVTPLVEKRDYVASELKEIQVNASGVSGAIFRAFAKMLNANVYYVSIIGNIFIAILLEALGIAAAKFLYSPEHRIKKVNPRTNSNSDPEPETEKELSNYRIVNGVNGLKLVDAKGNEIPFTVDGNHKAENPDQVNSARPIGFEVGDRSPGQNVNVNVNVDDKFKKLVARIKANGGKSDPYILDVYDNWNTYAPSTKFSYGNVSKLLKTFGVDVSKTYCHRVIRRERLGGGE